MTTLTAPPEPSAPPAPGGRPGWVTALWLAHGALRAVLLVLILAYAWSKIFLTQMGRADVGDALTTIGEKSPMGLLWTFMAFSPVVQFLAGAVELVAGLLLIWRRTAWLGGLVGGASMSVVFGLNMTFDVPVKQLSLAMAIGFLLVAAPELPRLARFATGRPTGPFRAPVPVPWPRVHRVTRWVLPALGLAVVAAAGVALFAAQPPLVPMAAPQIGAYRVVADTASPAPQLAADRRWAQVAFGQWEQARGGTGQVAIRYADGELQEGFYRPAGAGTVEVGLYPVLRGDRPLSRPVERRAVLSWAPQPDGRIAVTGDGQRLVIEPAAELRYLYDRPFSWNAPYPVNR